MKIEHTMPSNLNMNTERSVPRMDSVPSVTAEAVATSVEDAQVTAPISTPSVTADSNESLSDMRRKSRVDLSMTERDWIALIERANKAINGANKSFEYSIHEATKQIMVKIIDKDTKEVIREIPSEKILDMVAKMWELNGLFVDERR